MKFGNLQPMTKVPSSKPGEHWVFRCDCGTFLKRAIRDVRAVEKRGYAPACLECSFAVIRANGKKNRTHGMSVDYPKLYDVHRQMMRRCYDEDSADFKNYGGRGISICLEWHDCRAFVAWACISGYADGVTIERIDVNGNYNPENCTWIENERQAHNTRKVRTLTIDGNTRIISEWAKISGIAVNTIKTRLRLGWSHADAVRIPSMPGRNQYGVAT